MGHYYSEMRTPELHEKIVDFLSEHEGETLALSTKTGGELILRRTELRQLLRERANAREELASIKALFRRLSR